MPGILEVLDRAFETSTTVGAGTYTLDGAQVGFQALSNATANNYTTYFATDDTNWELGIGTILAGPNRLTRDKILSSSNAGAAVNWGAGTRKIRIGAPAAGIMQQRLLSKSVAGGADVALTADEQRRQVLEFTGLLTADISVTVDATPWVWNVYNNTTGAFTLTVKVAGQVGVAVTQGKRRQLYCNSVDVVAAYDDYPAVSGTVPAGALLDFGGTVIPSGYLACDGSNVSRATYATLFAAILRTSVVTFDNTTDKVAWASHGLSNGDVFKFTTTGAAPTGLTAGTTYFVVSAAANDFQIAATEGGAAINFTSNGTGVLTGIHAPHGDGDGSTTFGLPDSRRRATIGRGGTATSTIGARLGAVGGAETHTLVTAEMPGHTHTPLGGSSFITAAGSGSIAASGVNFAAAATTSSTGGDGAHNNMAPSLVVTKIIKT